MVVYQRQQRLAVHLRQLLRPEASPEVPVELLQLLRAVEPPLLCQPVLDRAKILQHPLIEPHLSSFVRRDGRQRSAGYQPLKRRSA